MIAETSTQQKKRILGLDYGSTRIGIAVSDPMRIIAKGVAVVRNTPRVWDRIRVFVREYDPEKIVVGMPFNLKGERGQKAQEVERFISRLREELELEVVPYDERFTSKIAHQTMREMGVKKQRRREKANVDLIAAAVILQDYLNTH